MYGAERFGRLIYHNQEQCGAEKVKRTRPNLT